MTTRTQQGPKRSMKPVCIECNSIAIQLNAILSQKNTFEKKGSKCQVFAKNDVFDRKIAKQHISLTFPLAAVLGPSKSQKNAYLARPV